MEDVLEKKDFSDEASLPETKDGELVVGDSRARKTLSAAEWAEIEAHYEYGTMRINEMQEKYDVTASAIYKHFEKLRKDGRVIRRGSKAHLLAEKTGEKIADESADKSAKTVSKFAQLRETRIEQSREAIFALDGAWLRIFAEVTKQVQNKVLRASDAFDDIRACHRAKQFLNDSWALRASVLGITDEMAEGDLPVLKFRDLSQEDLEELRRRHEDDEFDAVLPEEELDDDADSEIVEIIDGKPK